MVIFLPIAFALVGIYPTLLDSNKMIQEAEIVPHTSEDDAKKYLQELLNELNKQRTSNK